MGSREIVQALVAGLVGFCLGCAIINAAGGQSSAVSSSIDMAYTPAGQASPSKVMQGRREMMAGTFGLATAAANHQALAEAAAPKKRDSRLGFLAVAPAVALGWVGFNILGPATAQLDATNDRVADIAAGKRRADPAKPRFGVKVKGR